MEEVMIIHSPSLGSPHRELPGLRWADRRPHEVYSVIRSTWLERLSGTQQKSKFLQQIGIYNTLS